MADSHAPRTGMMMRIRQLASLAAIAVTAAACDSVLSTSPHDRLPAEGAIADLETARAALNGAYAALQSGGAYGLDVPLLGDLPSDNGRWVGTYQFLGEIADNRITADNPEVGDMWEALYRQVARDNVILADVPKLTDLDAADRDEILGAARFLRALSFHNLVKFWGAVPTPTTPVATPAEAAEYTRTPVSQVYDMILTDLDVAATLIPADADDTRRATLDAVTALRSRVLFYRAGLPGNANAAADYQGALDAANAVLDARGVDITTVPYASLFTAAGDDTAEDIFRVPFSASESNSLGSWWLAAGRFEAEPTRDLYDAYEPGDLRRDNVVGPRSATRLQGLKYPTTAGTSHPHVIRLGELVLIRAEVLARQDRLGEAVDAYNQLRLRAGLAPHMLGVDVTTRQEVLDAILQERRVELALEGDRWPDLVRLGIVVETLGLEDRAFQALFPIPLSDMNTSPLLEQNPGY